MRERLHFVLSRTRVRLWKSAGSIRFQLMNRVVKEATSDLRDFETIVLGISKLYIVVPCRFHCFSSWRRVRRDCVHAEEDVSYIIVFES